MIKSLRMCAYGWLRYFFLHKFTYTDAALPKDDSLPYKTVGLNLLKGDSCNKSPFSIPHCPIETIEMLNFF